MRALFCILFLLAFARPQVLKKNGTITCDVLSFSRKEALVSFTGRISSHKFWFIAPMMHRYTFRDMPQVQFGGGFRAGLKQYLRTRWAPHGNFVQLGVGYRFTRVREISEDYASNTLISLVHAPTAIAVIGRDITFGHKRDMVIGYRVGATYDYRMLPSGYAPGDLGRPMHEMPFLRGLMAYVGLEIGITTRMKDLHW